MATHGDEAGEDRQANGATLRELVARLNARSYDSAMELVTDDVEFDLAYPPDGLPMPVKGREAFHNLFTGIIAAMFETLVLDIIATYPGNDPDVIVAEYRSDGVVKANRNSYQNRYVGIFRFDDGKVSFWREYHNPEEATRALS